MTTATSTPPPVPLWAIEQLEAQLGRSYAGWEDKRPLYSSPPPVEDVDGYFDAQEVVRVIKVLRKMPHTKGRQWMHQPFDPEGWEVIWLIAPVFGWRSFDGLRLCRTVWLEIPRKNGKSTISARLALFLLTADGESAPEVYAAATSIEQAGQVFEESKTVAARSPSLQQRTERLTRLIRSKRNNGIFRVLSRMADTSHGLNVSGAVIDEIHLHKKKELIEAIETGTGAREQPLIVFITTAGDEDPTTPYAAKHDYAVKVCQGEFADLTTWAVIWAAAPGMDPYAEETWAFANPNYPMTPRRDYMQKQALLAQRDPSFTATFARLHLNIRSDILAEAWTGAEAWVKGAGMVVSRLDDLKGKRAYGGLCAASATDLASLCWLFRSPDGDESVWALWRYFFPEGGMVDLRRRSGGHADDWVKKGWLTLTEGDQLDIEGITAAIRADGLLFNVRELAFDASGTAIGITQPLQEDFGDRLISVYPSTPGSSMVDWEQMLRSGTFNHGGNPISSWQVAKLSVRQTAADVVRIDRKGSPENVYGLTAAELALRRLLVAKKPRRSVYEDRGLSTA